MTKVLAVAKREIAERSFAFAAAAGFALGPLLVFLTPAQHPREFAAMTDILIAIAFILGLGVLLGGSLIGHEAREQRLSFYFSRPVSGSTVWWGKLLGAIALIFGVTVIDFVLPLIYWPNTQNLFSYSSLIVWLIVASIALMLIVNAIAGMVRSRSPLLIADLAAAVLFIAVTALIIVPFILDGAIVLAQVLVDSIAVATLLLLAFAGSRQLERGRVDVRRAHVELSRFVWTSLAIVLATAGAYALWVRSSSPWDRRNVVRSHGGPLAIVNDAAAFRNDRRSPYRLDYHPVFIVDTASHRYVRANRSLLMHAANFDAAGTALAWPAPSLDIARFRLGPDTLRVARMVDGQLRAIDTGLVWSRGDEFALSPNGDRIAIVKGDRLQVHDVASDRILAVTRLPKATLPDMISPDVVRLYAFDDKRLIAFDFDVRRRALQKSIDVPKPTEKARFITVLPHDAGHAVVWCGPRDVELLDVRSGTYTRMPARR